MLRKIVLLVCLSLLAAVPALAGEPGKTVIQVNGHSQKEIVPDRACISLTISSIDIDLEKAKDDNAQTVNKILTGLKAQGISGDQIRTNTYQIDPIYNYDKKRLPELKGYRVTEGLEVRTPTEKIGILVNEIVKSGIVEINSIRFEAASETNIKSQALEEAVKDALHKAEVIAKALDKRIVHVKQVNESGVSYRPVMLENVMMAKFAAADGATPNIVPGKLTVSATVQATVELD